jgi:hypothetical protein
VARHAQNATNARCFMRATTIANAAVAGVAVATPAQADMDITAPPVADS